MPIGLTVFLLVVTGLIAACASGLHYLMQRERGPALLTAATTFLAVSVVGLLAALTLRLT